MKYVNEPSSGLRRVRVPGREDIGEVIQAGKNFGSPSRNIYCDVVYFPETGEVAFYDKRKIETADD